MQNNQDNVVKLASKPRQVNTDLVKRLETLVESVKSGEITDMSWCFTGLGGLMGQGYSLNETVDNFIFFIGLIEHMKMHFASRMSAGKAFTPTEPPTDG